MTTASEQRVLDALGDLSEARRRLHNYRDTAAVLESKDLQAQYAGQWVAAYGGEVVGHSDDLRRLLGALSERGIPRRDLVVRHVTGDEPELV